MGYSLKIGEAAIYSEDPKCGVLITVTLLPDGVTGSPLNSTNDHSNCILPSYGGWEDFTDRHGLHDIFWRRQNADRGWRYGDEEQEYAPLMAEHPSAGRLYPAHLGAFLTALDRYDEDIDGGDSTDLRRLQWLCFWTDWALKNCKCPVLANS